MTSKNSTGRTPVYPLMARHGDGLTAANKQQTQTHLLFATAILQKTRSCVWGILLTMLILCTVISQTKAQSSATLQSPDGHIQMQLSAGAADQGGPLQYSIYYKAPQSALASGHIGFTLEDHKDSNRDFGSAVKAIELTAARKKEKRTLQTRGNHNEAKIIKNAYHLLIKSKDGRSDFTLTVNMYNNGVAYRYSLPASASGSESGSGYTLTLTRTTSQISLPPATTLWWQQDVHTYEANYHTAAFNQLPDSLRLGMPLTLKYANGMYAALSEANIFGFAGSYLTHYKGENH